MQYLRRVHRDEGGFTLIELLIVVAIIAILLAIAVPSYLAYRGRAVDRVAQSDLRAAIPSAEAYRADHDDYSGLDKNALRAYDPGLAPSIDHVAATGTGAGYCLGATVNSRSWSVAGPDATGWYATDDCTGASVQP